MIVFVFYVNPYWIYFNLRPPELFSVLIALVYEPLPLSNSAHTIIFRIYLLSTLFLMVKGFGVYSSKAPWNS